MKKRNTALSFVLFTVLIDMIGFGIIIPVIPQLLKSLLHVEANEASRYGMYLFFVYALMQFIFSPIIGGLSDRYGRKPVLLISLLGLGIDYLFLAFAPTYGWFFIGRLIAGIAGGSYTTAMAYVADVSNSERKAQNFGLVGAAFGLGFIIGPVLGGYFSSLGERVPFIVAAGLSAVNLVYGLLVLPESLSKDKRRRFEWNRANPLGTLKLFKRYPELSGFVVVMFLIHIAGHSVRSNWSFYTDFMFHWDPAEIGRSLGVIGIMIALVQGGLIRFTIPKLGYKRSIYIGMLLWCTGLVLFALANEGWMMYAFIAPYCLGGIAIPAIQGLLSHNVPDNEQGELQGAITSLVSITNIIGPIIMMNVFYYFTNEKAIFTFPGIPFIIGASLIMVSMFFAYHSLSAMKIPVKNKS